MRGGERQASAVVTGVFSEGILDPDRQGLGTHNINEVIQKQRASGE